MEYTFDNNAIGNIQSTLYVVTNVAIAYIDFARCYNNRVKGHIVPDIQNYVYANIIVRTSSINTIVGNIVHADLSNVNTVKLNITTPYSNDVIASISAPQPQGEWVKGRIDEISADNIVAANLQVANASIPENVKNITVGFSNQPGILSVYNQEEQTQTMASGIVLNRGIESTARTYKAIITTTSGSEGNFTNFQEAINYVADLGGGDIFIESGTYTIASGINLQSNIHLVGDDYNTTILDFAHGDYTITASGTSSNRMRNMFVENLTISGCRARNKGSITFAYSDICGARFCKFVDNYSSTNLDTYDVMADNCQRVHVEDCVQHGSFRMLQSSYTNHFYFRRNHITEGYGDIINTLWNNYGYVENNYIGPSLLLGTEHALLYFVYTGYVFVTNNSCAETVRRISWFYGGGQSIIGNNFMSSGGSADYNIYIQGASRFTITGNFLKVAQGHAVYLVDTDYTCTTGNVFTDNNIDHAFESDADCTYTTLVANTFYNNPGGIYSVGGTKAYAAGNNY